jgi:sortase (surface protein transpeptidase)
VYTEEPQIAPVVDQVEATEPKISSKVSSLVLKTSKIIALIGMGLILLFYAPKIIAWGKDYLGTTVKNFGISISEIRKIKDNKKEVDLAYQPAFDPTLPKTNRLVVSSIGVDTDIEEATLDNYENALKNGVWRVSDFGDPASNNESIILAAHRFGYLAWTNSFRRKNSFYNLPKMRVGDIVEIDWKQRKYQYEVYSTDKGTEITDYSADLILYTCENLTGDARVFVYAKLIQ